MPYFVSLETIDYGVGSNIFIFNSVYSFAFFTVFKKSVENSIAYISYFPFQKLILSKLNVKFLKLGKNITKFLKYFSYKNINFVENIYKFIPYFY